MKVLFVISRLDTGGAEIMLLKLLENFDRDAIEPCVISLSSTGEVGKKIEALNIPLHSIGLNKLDIAIFGKLLKLCSCIKDIKPDLVQTWMYHADLLGGIVARLMGCKNVIWGLRSSHLSKVSTKRMTLFVVKLCALFSRLIPIKIIACSKRAAVYHSNIGFASNKIDVIPNGFDLNRFVPCVDSKRSVRVELAIPDDAKLVGVVGRYDPQKNYLGFMESAVLIKKAFSSVYFILIGKNVDKENMELVSTIKSNSLDSSVRLLGLREDIPRLMSSLDVLVSASIYGEAFPNVIGEAMACGTPCVVTDVGDSADIVGNTGKVVQPYDTTGLATETVKVLSMSPQEILLLSQMARVRVKSNYEIGCIAQRYQSYYMEIK